MPENVCAFRNPRCHRDMECKLPSYEWLREHATIREALLHIWSRGFVPRTEPASSFTPSSFHTLRTVRSPPPTPTRPHSLASILNPHCIQFLWTHPLFFSIAAPPKNITISLITTTPMLAVGFLSLHPYTSRPNSPSALSYYSIEISNISTRSGTTNCSASRSNAATVSTCCSRPGLFSSKESYHACIPALL